MEMLGVIAPPGETAGLGLERSAGLECGDDITDHEPAHPVAPVGGVIDSPSRDKVASAVRNGVRETPSCRARSSCRNGAPAPACLRE